MRTGILILGSLAVRKVDEKTEGFAVGIFIVALILAFIQDLNEAFA